MIKINFHKIKRYFILFFFLGLITIPLTMLTYGTYEKILTYSYAHVFSVNNKTGTKIIFDESGVPIVDYGTLNGIYIGRQRNPVTIAQEALNQWEKYQSGDENSKYLFLNCTNWLVENAVQRGNYSVWEYQFPWPVYNVTPPWVSGMAEGQGIQVLSRAYMLTGNQEYLNISRKSLLSFYINVDEGGVSYKDSSTGGWWYEEYASKTGKNPRVLNGFMFSLIALHEYYVRTGDKDANYLFEKGIVELKANLSKYDTGSWTYYDSLNNIATNEYHIIHVQQLSELYNITNDKYFNEYKIKFQNYEENPYNLLLRPLMGKIGKIIFIFNFLSLLFIYLIVVYLKNLKGSE